MATETVLPIADFSLLTQHTFSQLNVSGVQPSATKHDLLSFLATAQALEVPFLPVTWQPTEKIAKNGGTSRIQEARANISTNLAFKCIKESEKREKTEATLFQMLINELVVLGHERIRAHPNVVRLQGISWDISTAHKIWPVLVFRKSHWGDLSDFMASPEGRALSIRQRAELGFNIGDAIVDMHTINVVHGDLKPENVLVYRFSDDHRYPSRKFTARVTDFGYSSRYADDEHLISLPISRPWNAPEHTRINRLWSPEEAKKADLFSAGLLFLWILFGDSISQARLLDKEGIPEKSRESGSFDRERSRECTSATLLKYKINKTLPTLARQLIKAEDELQDNEKSNLEEFFNSVLSDNPDERDALSTRLPVFDRHKKVEKTASGADFKIELSLSELYRCDFRVRRSIVRRLEETFNLATMQGREADAHKIAYQLALCHQIGFAVRRDESKSKQMLMEAGCHELKLTRLKAKKAKYPHDDSAWLKSGDLPNESFLEEQDLEEALSQLSQEAKDLSLALGDEHVLTFNLKGQIANILGIQGRYDELEILSKELMNTSLKIWGPRGIHTGGSMNNLAMAYVEQGRLAEAEKLLSREILVAQSVDGLPDETILESLGSSTAGNRPDFAVMNLIETSPELPTILQNLATIYQLQERLEEAEKLQFRAFCLVWAKLGVDHIKTLEAMIEIASTLYSSWRFDEAQELYVDVQKSLPGVLPAQHPTTLRVEAGLALIHSQRGNHAKAVQLGMQVLQAQQRILGLRHRDTLDSLGNMTTIFCRSQQWGRAEEKCRQLISIRNQTLGVEHPLTLDAMVPLMRIYFDQERWSEAQNIALQVSSTRHKLLGVEHIATVNATHDLADIYTKQGRWKEAEDLYVRVVETRKRLLGAEHNNTIACMICLVNLYLSWGQERLADAQQLASEILATSVRVLGPNNSNTLTSMENLAVIYLKVGNGDEAIKLMESVTELRTELKGPNHVDTLHAMENLATVYLESGLDDKAVRLRESVKELKSQSEGPNNSCLEEDLQPRKTYRVKDQLFTEPEYTFGSYMPYGECGTVENVRRVRELYRREEDDLEEEELIIIENDDDLEEGETNGAKI